MSRSDVNFERVRKIVVKIGSALLTEKGTGLVLERIASIAAQLTHAIEKECQVVLVSSGAIAEGCNRLGWSSRPETVHELQAAAAVGQIGLAEAWEGALKQHGTGAAMIMLTHEDLADRQRYLNARATLQQLLQLGVVPIINENDTVATEEIKFGDNDSLAALVANLIEADLLIILTDVEGLLDKDPSLYDDAKVIHHGMATDDSLSQFAGEPGVLGRGGMVTKLSAARLAARSGAHTVIASGQNGQVLNQILFGVEIGTFLEAEVTPLTARKRWIAGHLRAKGSLTVDSGAARVLVKDGVSLLAVGVIAVTGSFERGDVVRIQSDSGQAIAQGLSNYASGDVQRLLGKRTEEFGDHIDFVGEPELVHRDNLVVLVSEG